MKRATEPAAWKGSNLDMPGLIGPYIISIIAAPPHLGQEDDDLDHEADAALQSSISTLEGYGCKRTLHAAALQGFTRIHESCCSLA